MEVAVLVERHPIRLLTEADIPWLHQLSHKRYPQFDHQTTEGWFRHHILKNPMLALPIRSDNAFTISLLVVWPWTGEIECNNVFVCADHGAMWEAIKLMRATARWAKGRGATWFRMGSDTDFDFGAIARRIGANDHRTRYSVRLT